MLITMRSEMWAQSTNYLKSYRCSSTLSFFSNPARTTHLYDPSGRDSGQTSGGRIRCIRTESSRGPVIWATGQVLPPKS